MEDNELSNRICEQVKDLGENKRCIVDSLVRYSRENHGIAVCSYRIIQRETGKSLSTIFLVMKRLKEKGLVVMKHPSVFQVSQSGLPEFTE